MPFVNDTEAVAAPRAAVGRAIQKFFEARNAAGVLDPESGVLRGLYVESWVVSASYTCSEYEQTDIGGGGQIVPDGQLIPTTVGLLAIGQRRFG